MSERCIVAVRFTPATPVGDLRSAVDGFLRYLQHRDLPGADNAQDVRASGNRTRTRVELFGPAGTVDAAGRKDFAAFVGRSIDQSRPQLFRGQDGKLYDRRRAVYRVVISPEHGDGVDLRRLTKVAVGVLESASHERPLRWLAAIHRNTAHPHIHLVLAGQRESEAGYNRIDLTRERLVAMKQAVSLELERQRAERAVRVKSSRTAEALPPDENRLALLLPGASMLIFGQATPDNRSGRPRQRRIQLNGSRPAMAAASALLRLRTAARHYQRRMEGDLNAEAERRGWARTV